MDGDPNGLSAFPPLWCEDPFVLQAWSSFDAVMQAKWIETHPDNHPLNTNRSTSKRKKASGNNSAASHTVKRTRVGERASEMNSDQARDLDNDA